MTPRPPRPAGFTLVELLVTVAIIALLVGLALPVLNNARQAAQTSVCASNLHQLGIATHSYLDESDGRVWRYYRDVPGGRLWWFGYEAGGPGNGTGRPLDKSRGVLARYLDSTDDRLQCPSFPYTAGEYFPKFKERAASYGFNLDLWNPKAKPPPPPNRTRMGARASTVAIFADAVHFDHNPGYNEGHYIQYSAGAQSKGGYAHFRHGGRAQVLMLDTRVDSQDLSGPAYRESAPGGPAGNLSAPDGSSAIYGF